MKTEVDFVLCALVVLTSSSQTIGENSPSPPPASGTFGSPGRTLATSSPLPADPKYEAEQTLHNLTWPTTDGWVWTPNKPLTVPSKADPEADRDESGTVSSRATTSGHADSSVSMSKPTASVSAGHASPTGPGPSQAPWLTSMPPGTAVLTHNASSSTSSTSSSSLPPSIPPKQPSTQPWTEAGPLGPPGPLTTRSHASTGSTHQEIPSELNVGDEAFKGPPQRPSSPLDPLLAGLVSVFIVTTAIISVVLFLKFRHQSSRPEFHRLHDLPMDDLMEDTPLSMYSY